MPTFIGQKYMYHKQKHSSVTDANIEVGPELSTEKNKYMFMSHHHITR
jgi:hypothetical protein